jgi:hypothetical protein
MAQFSVGQRVKVTDPNDKFNGDYGYVTAVHHIDPNPNGPPPPPDRFDVQLDGTTFLGSQLTAV